MGRWLALAARLVLAGSNWLPRGRGRRGPCGGGLAVLRRWQCGDGEDAGTTMR